MKPIEEGLRAFARAHPETLRAICTQAFGKEISLSQLANGDIPLPRHVRWVSAEALGGADGAYSPKHGGTVYLSEALRGDPQARDAVYAEEAGHHLDSVLAGPDAKGDEGNIFAQALARGRTLTEEELAAPRADRDHGVIEVRGRLLDVEFARPEDAAPEMIGRRFVLAAETFVGMELRPSEIVTAEAWDNNSDLALVHGAEGSFRVPKSSLMPAREAVPGVPLYTIDIEQREASLHRAEAQRAASEANEAEVTRLDGIIATHQAALNRELIQETMYNGLDGIIKDGCDRLNREHGLSGEDALDPSLVKSMLFEESKNGTSGVHLEAHANAGVRSRFNVGQAIDSAGIILLTKFEREQNADFLRAFPDLRSDLEAAQRDPAQRALREDPVLGLKNWEPFIRAYVSPVTGETFSQFVQREWNKTTPPANESYAYWTNVAIDWLYEKKAPGMSWEDAIQAYNGSGPAAARYRARVVERARVSSAR